VVALNVSWNSGTSVARKNANGLSASASAEVFLAVLMERPLGGRLPSTAEHESVFKD
jgi:hypothetical protein